MKLCITLEHRFLQTPDGKIWTITQCPYSFFQEYLEVFSSVRVISRVFPVDAVEPNFLAVEGPGVEFYAMPAYKGPIGYLSKRRAVAERARLAVPEGAAVILRAHSQIANAVERELTRRSYPYAVDVVADPWDVLSPAANHHPIAPIARRHFTRNLKRQCRQAVSVAYVTESYLQQRYPSRSDAVLPHVSRRKGDLRQRSIGVSDVCLESAAFVEAPRTAMHSPGELAVLFVGTLESLYKGPDVLVDAIAECKARGLTVRARFLGDGSQIPALRERCARLGVHGRVEFVGNVTAGDPVRGEMDKADVYVLPSRAEGVPRAMLEAMARSLPCVGTKVGGIPELLDAADLVPQDDPSALADQLCSIATDPVRYSRMADRNLRKANEYARVVLAEPRRHFYNSVRDLTSAHLAAERSEDVAAVPQDRPLIVVHVVEGCQGGVGTAVNHLINGQIADQQIGAVHLFADPTRLGDMLQHTPAVLHSYKSSRRLTQLGNVAADLQLRIAALQPDVVYLHSTFPGVYGRWKTGRVEPSWTTLYCPHGWAFTQNVGWLKHMAYLFAEKRFAPRADAIISISHAEFRAAEQGGLRHPRHRVIPHGLPAPVAPAEAALTPPADHLHLLFVGRFDRQKGLDLLLRAWQDPRLEKLHLWLIGDTTLGSDFKDPRQPNIHRLGWIPNQQIDGYIRSFQAVIVPSRWEGFGLVALEAMRNGRAVLASRTGGLQELVIDGANGRLFDPQDTDSLVHLLAGLTREDLERMGRTAEAVFRTGFEWGACYSQWSGLSAEAMATRSGFSTAKHKTPASLISAPVLGNATKGGNPWAQRY